MADHRIFEQSNFMLQKGAVLPTVQLAYKTLGELNPTRDNAVLVPTWYTGTHRLTRTGPITHAKMGLAAFERCREKPGGPPQLLDHDVGAATQ